MRGGRGGGWLGGWWFAFWLWATTWSLGLVGELWTSVLQLFLLTKVSCVDKKADEGRYTNDV